MIFFLFVCVKNPRNDVLELNTYEMSLSTIIIDECRFSQNEGQVESMEAISCELLDFLKVAGTLNLT